MGFASNALWDYENDRSGAVQTLTYTLERQRANTNKTAAFGLLGDALNLSALDYLRIDLKAFAAFLIDTIRGERGQFKFRVRVSNYYQLTVKADTREQARAKAASGAAIPNEFWTRLFALEQEYGLCWYANDIDVLDEPAN